ncbi:uncharacterized protein SCDLUD_004622 [Saccharomycodes ludwigii]|nr:hypothetical protein SCDLUD_004622 [Saccharomycodes ludwigii]KAH3899192.1 hypothetical protein SCDLUD_004622 [Saccharomycodes ludwigii]
MSNVSSTVPSKKALPSSKSSTQKTRASYASLLLPSSNNSPSNNTSNYGSIDQVFNSTDIRAARSSFASTHSTIKKLRIDFSSKRTTLLEELKFIVWNSIPITLTFFMQYSLTVSCLFIVGNLCIDPETGSSAEYLSSASLAVMTYNITGAAVIEGMATSLDTFCSQAYGAGKYKKVGLYVQRCTLMIMCILTPIVISWWFSASWLKLVIPEVDLLYNTQRFLRVLIIGLPGVTMFETGKRFAQSQGYYNITTFALFFAFPINLILIFIFTKKFGFIGAPYAIAVSQWLMFLSLALYCIYIQPITLKCWPSIWGMRYERLGNNNDAQTWFSPVTSMMSTVLSPSTLFGRTVSNEEEDNVILNEANDSNVNFQKHPIFQHWLPMWNLSFPGLVMIESEYLSFEVLTIMSSYFGVEAIAAQTIIATLGTLIFQIPFAVGCVLSTRVAQYIGSHYHYYKNNLNDEQAVSNSNNVIESRLAELNSKTCIYASYLVGLLLGFCNFLCLYVFAEFFAGLFTKDESVIKLSAQSLPIVAANQLPDTFNVFSASILRGQGR